MVIIAALIIRIGCWTSGIAVMANDTENEDRSTGYLLEDYPAELKENKMLEEAESIQGIQENILFEKPQNMFEMEDKTAVGEEPDADEDIENVEKETVNNETVVSGIRSLQIPQKLEIVIDPWEMDGRGQIYSETYVIRNNGDEAGILTLSNLACKAQESSGVTVRSDKNGLHDNKEKSLYMEMWFGDSEMIVLSEQGVEYQAEMEPSEEVMIRFVGEVNEYVTGKWGNEDVKVSVAYSWELEESPAEENVDDKGTAETEENEVIDPDSKEKADVLNNNEKLEEIKEFAELKELEEQEEIEKIKENEIVEDFRDDEYLMKGIESFQEEADGTKVIRLLESEETRITLDSWKAETDHHITSAKFHVQNVGEKTGILSWKDIVCRLTEEDEIAVNAIRYEEKSADERFVFVEIVLGNDNKDALTQADYEHKVELKAGEELTVQFAGIIDGKMLEEGEEDSVVIDAAYFWDVEA